MFTKIPGREIIKLEQLSVRAVDAPGGRFVLAALPFDVGIDRYRGVEREN